MSRYLDFVTSLEQQPKPAAAKPIVQPTPTLKPLVGAGPLLPGQSRVAPVKPLVGAGPLLPGQTRTAPKLQPKKEPKKNIFQKGFDFVKESFNKVATSNPISKTYDFLTSPQTRQQVLSRSVGNPALTLPALGAMAIDKSGIIQGFQKQGKQEEQQLSILQKKAGVQNQLGGTLFGPLPLTKEQKAKLSPQELEKYKDISSSRMLNAAGFMGGLSKVGPEKAFQAAGKVINEGVDIVKTFNLTIGKKGKGLQILKNVPKMEASRRLLEARAKNIPASFTENKAKVASKFLQDKAGKFAGSKSNLETIFHGTDKKFKNFDVKKSADGTVWFTNNKTDLTDPARGVAASGKGVIMERQLPKNLKLATPEQIDKFSVNELINQGYDGVKYTGDKTTGTFYQMFHPEKLINKSPSKLAKIKGLIDNERGGINFGAKVGGSKKAESIVDRLFEEAKKYKSADEFVKANLPAYHGSPVPLKKFNNKQGTFFTSSYENATGFAGNPDNVYEGFINFKKPLVIDAKGAKWDKLNTKFGKSTQEVISNAQKAGYDGITFKNIVDNAMDTAGIGGKDTIHYAFKPRDSFLNESQLTEIYNKATKPKLSIKNILKDQKGFINFGAKVGKEEVPEIVPKAVRGVEEAKPLSSTSSIPYTQLDQISQTMKSSSDDYLRQVGHEIDNIQGKERGFITSVKEATRTSPEVAGKVKGSYVPLSNEQSYQEGLRLVEADAVKARDIAMKETSARASMAGQILIEKAQKMGNYDEATKLVEDLAAAATEKGQAVQALSYWGRLNPTGMLRYAERAIREANEHLTILDKLAGGRVARIGQRAKMTPELTQAITRNMKEAQLLPPGAERDALTQQTLELINQHIPPSVSEAFDSFRYQNMLSGARSQERNILGNLYQTFVTRPMDLAFSHPVDWFKSTLFGKARTTYAADVPTYYKETINSIPNAMLAFKESLKGKTALTNPDIKGIRHKVLPGALTGVQRFMTGADRFFSTMIAAGEKSRLIRQGVEPGVAQKEAAALAEEYLYRGSKGVTAKSEPLFARAIDGVSEAILSVRKVPIIGKPFGWFAPFVRTPQFIARSAITHSPLGLIGGDYSSAQVGRALAGSTVLGVGAIMAGQGRTTFAAPTDPQAKKLFYDSGKRPYSIKVGNTWVPSWYFGPFGLSLMVPAAYKYYDDEAPTALTDNQVDKLTRTLSGVTRYLATQTTLQGISTALQLIEGDQDISPSKITGSLASQVVPFTGLLRNIAETLDDVYRKPKGFGETLMAGIPFLSKKVGHYETSTGEPAKRELRNVYLPYPVGTGKPINEQQYLARQQELQSNKINTAFKEGALTSESAKNLLSRLGGLKSAGTVKAVNKPKAKNTRKIKVYRR